LDEDAEKAQSARSCDFGQVKNRGGTRIYAGLLYASDCSSTLTSAR
jgi:hypothetical protein